MDVLQVVTIIIITSTINLLILAILVRHEFRNQITKMDM